MAAHTSQEHAHRAARYAELALLCLTGVGITVLIVLWGQLESLLPPGESLALVRARLLRGLFSLAVPLVTLLFLSQLRGRVAALLKKQGANPATVKSAKYLWFLVMAFVIVIIAIDTFVIVKSFQDIDFN